MIDSCYSGWFIRNKSESRSVGPNVDPAVITSRVVSAFSAPAKSSGLAAKTSLPASTEAKGKYRILVSSASTQESYIFPGDNPVDDASLFTYHLAAGGGIQPVGWEMAPRMLADANRNNIVSLYELFRYTEARVNSAVAQMNKKYKPIPRIQQSVRVWPAGSSFPVVQRTP